MEQKQPVSEQSDVELIQHVIELLRRDIALQIVGRALTEDEQRRIARAQAVLPHLEQAIAAMQQASAPL